MIVRPLPTAAALMMLCALVTTASAQTRIRDEVVVLHGPRRALSDAEVLAVPPIVNRLRPPDTSGVAASMDPELGAAGAMTPDGMVGQTRAFGSFGIPYTSTRVQDGVRAGAASGVTNASRLSTTYPYRAIGKLTFDQGYCSASLIRRSVIVTAAHCIQAFGGGANIFTNFQFRPGHYGASGATSGQIAPYGTWFPFLLVRAATWANGTDVGTGSARDNDVAVMALSKSGGQFLGDITSYLGYGWNNYSFVTSSKTGNLHTAAVSTLGYPFLLDGGAIMQRTDGPTYTTLVGPANQLWQGSNLTGGASGGPWIVNFATRNAALAGGAVVGDQSVGPTVIGVTSWGAADPNAPKDNYSSQFRQNQRYPNASYGTYGAGNIAAMLNTLCGGNAPEGGSLAANGYCD